MYNKLNITENSLRVLSLFTNDFKREYYIREINKILNISPRTSQLILEDLESKGIVESTIKGKIKLFKLNYSDLTKRYLIFTEQYKTITFLENNDLIKEIIEKITPHINGIGVIFGSYAKGIEKSNSDLDIFIIGQCDNKEINNISKIYGIEISIKSYTTQIFEKRLKTDIFLKEILKNHIIFLNVEEFMKKVLENE